MWDPDNVFARCDDDVLSWRSFDTTLGAEADADGGAVSGVDADAYAVSEPASDASGRDELAELTDRSHADVLRLSRYAPRPLQSALNSPHHDSESESESTQAIKSKWLAVGPTTADPGKSSFSNSAFKEESSAIMLRIEKTSERSPPSQSITKELPSTSEMVSIADGIGSTSRWSSEPQIRLPRQNLFESPTRVSQAAKNVGEPHWIDGICHTSPQRRQLEITSRERFFPGELVGGLEFKNAKHTTNNVYGGDLFLLAQQQQPYSVNHKPNLQLKQSQQRQPMSLSQLLAQSRDGHDPPPPVNRLQNDQMHQRVLHIQQLEAELEGKSVQIRQAHNEEKKWREKSIHLEIQVQYMQSLLIEKEKREEENLQALAQKTAELVSLQTRCLSLQDANETFQEQAKKAVDEKERVQRDYLQVVYDLGKAQKQFNSISKETVAITEKDFLLREIGQLQKDNEELQQKVKDVETKRGLGSSSLSDSQQISGMQKHIQELEDELQKLRVARSGAATSQAHQPPPAPSIHPTRGNQLYAFQSNLSGNSFQSVHIAPSSKDRTATTNLMFALSSMDFSGRRELSLHQQQPAAAGGDSYSGSKTERPMTLKDIMAGLRSGGGPGSQPSHQGNSMSQPLSLASMGFTNLNGSKPQQQCFNLEQFKAEAMVRRGIGVPGTAADPAVWQHCSSNPTTNVFASSSSSRSASFPPVDSSATMAPFAMERQSFQLDAVQRRRLEQKLMHLQLEKDQMEAKAMKLEQTGLRTMNARSEKQRLDAKIQALAQDVGKLKLTLRLIRQKAPFSRAFHPPTINLFFPFTTSGVPASSWPFVASQSKNSTGKKSDLLPVRGKKASTHSSFEQQGITPHQKESIPGNQQNDTMTTAADVLQRARFEERVAEIELKLPAVLALVKDASLAKRNQVKRQLYHDAELLRIELEEQMNIEGIEKEYLTAPEIQVATAKLDAIRKQLRLDVLPATHSQLEKVYSIARFATFALLLVGWFSALVFAIPLRFIGPYLRELGVKKNHLPIDWISWGMAYLMCLAAGTDTRIEGREHLTDLEDSVVCMYNHASNLDGFIVNASSPTAFKFAAKKSVFLVPFLGWMSRWGFGFVAIDRGNRSSALKSLKELATSVNEEGNSVCISPEGTRSKDGLLQEFKKGPFYLREDTKKNVVPAVVFGAYELWPPGRLITIPGKALIRFLPEYVADPSKSRNLNRLALRRIFLKAFTEDVPEDIGTAAGTNGILRNIFGIYLIWALTFKVTSISFSVISTVCYVIGISYWTFSYLCFVVLLGLEALMFFTC